MSKQNQSNRLTNQHKESNGVVVLFLEGSNFLTETISIKRHDGRVVTLEYNSGMLNRLDRLTSANYGMPINTNLCENKFVKHKDKNNYASSNINIYTREWQKNA
jgi:type II restriction enzyme